MNTFFSRQQKKTRAQAMIEFMLTLPVLIVLIYGTIEVARLIFIFSSVANASRQAARYGAASGEIDDTHYYQDCEGIRDVANESAFIITFDEIKITYDRGIAPDGTQIPIGDIDPSPDMDTCPVDENIIRNGDRIIVQVSATYEPIIPILPIEPLKVVSASARTFLISVPIVGSALPFSFAAESPTPSKIPTSSSSIDTPTVTPFFTFTRVPPSGGGTPFGGVNPTSTIPPTLTFTPSRTPPASVTPSITPTPISCTGLTGVWHGPLFILDNVMEMEIINETGHVLSAAQVYVEWNHDTGHQSSNDRTLHLKQVVLASQTWNGDIHSPSAYIPAYYPFIPTGVSKVQFIFHQNYNLTDGTERIIITIGTPGCVNYPVDSRN
ncbi:MAG: pilus assembly protein [Anaerolineales bacterium]|nr:MAG: pilus assembly protein [Anaerolineales bacterium]